jgi:hypothetical protein
VAALAIALFAGALVLVSTPYTFEEDASSMTISGTSTLHDWTCDVERVEGRLSAQVADAQVSETQVADAQTASARQTANAGGDAASAAPGVPLKDLKSVTVQVPVDAIECGKSRMNRNLREALKANSYPKIIFTMSTATFEALPDSAGAWFRVDAAGELIIAGTRQNVTLDVRGERLGDGRLRFTGETPLKMSTYEVDAPSFMLGTVKTGDEVTVTFDVVAAPQS